MNTALITNVVIAGIDRRDAPDFCDAYIESADYNGEPMTDEQLDEINDNSEFVHEKVLNWLY